MAKRQMSTEQLEQYKARRAAFAKMAGHISAMTPEARADLAAKLPAIVTIEGRPLSIFNQCLLAMQCPTTTIVGGFKQWLTAGRCVRKGEHGLMIWCPSSKASDDDSKTTEIRFIPGTVFDVAQTDAIETEQAA